MSTFALDAPVDVRPYTSRTDGADAVIGDDLRGVYLSVSADGLELLESLAAGLTVRETIDRFEESHDFSPDMEDFLDMMSAEGFVALSGTLPTDDGRRRGHRWRFWNLEWLSPRAAQRILSWPVALVGGIIVATGIALVLNDPSTLPGPSSLKFENHVYLWLLYIFGMSGVLLHELGHVVGARAAGVSGNLRIGNQMFTIVAETDISGIWLASKRQRYIALLAGPFIDLVGVGLMEAALWMAKHGVIDMPEPVHIVLSGLMLTYFFRIQWQICVFVRTDLYYVVATALGVPSLMADTRAYMRNISRRLRGRQLIDQTGVGDRERLALRLFAVLWIAGRGLQVVILCYFSIPVLVFYITRITRYFMGVTPGQGAFTGADVLSVSLLIIIIEGGGLILWGIQLTKARRARMLAPNRVYVE